ncbi:MAG TPA: DNA-formamidopyrimidine glycosylase family protein [Candidatus Thermoplasmatota archaeon]|nr:DNA-formamidopyrimidine glycosylase family protein [Candidatus Thermoplasmatota archaeon]
MPELPDVEGFRRRFERLAKGRTVARVDVEARGRMLLAPESAVRSALRGRRLGATRRIGKWMFAKAGGDLWLALHFGMTGDVEEVGERDPPYARLVLRFRGGGGVAFTDPRRFGRIALAASPEAFADEHGLGPDAMELTERAFLRRIEGRRVGAKALLLDQGVLAGVGNLWADEALWQARIHPATRVEDLEDEARRRLFRAMRSALRRALRKPGDYEALPRTWLLPHRRVGGRCPRCGERLAPGAVAGRTTFWCPKEQRR